MKKKSGSFKRNCPNCGKVIQYKHKRDMVGANEKCTNCKSCAKTGENHPMYGKHYPSYIIENRNIPKGKNHPMYGKPGTMLGKRHSEYTKQKQSNANSGRNNPMYGSKGGFFEKKHSTNTLRKLRKFAIKRIERNIKNGGQITPFYNPEACKIIEQYGKEHGYNFQHAENGGEYHIKELGYWVDGYDEEKNVVIEYYEPFHKKQIERDERRQTEIVDYLKCKFIIITE